MIYLKLFAVIIYVLIAISLIGLGIFKKITIEDGEVIEKYNQYKMVYKITTILFGLVMIGLTYCYYEKKIHGVVLLFSLLIIDILQKIINNIYIKEGEIEMVQGTTELAEKINIDEIMEEDFFDKKKLIEETKKDDYSKIVNNLILEGIQRGILKNTDSEEESNIGSGEVKDIVIKPEDTLSEDEGKGELIEIDFSKK